jgi:peptide/nickel transport system ATP-binding protein
MTVLSVENLSLSYRTGRQWREVVHNVSFTLKRGEMLAFVGESGSGKTTTAQRLLACWQTTPAAMAVAFC